MDAPDEFLDRGEAAWQSYLQTGVSRPAEAVIARLQAALDAKRAWLGAEGANSCGPDAGRDLLSPVSTGQLSDLPTRSRGSKL